MALDVLTLKKEALDAQYQSELRTTILQQSDIIQQQAGKIAELQKEADEAIKAKGEAERALYTVKAENESLKNLTIPPG